MKLTNPQRIKARNCSSRRFFTELHVPAHCSAIWSVTLTILVHHFLASGRRFSEEGLQKASEHRHSEQLAAGRHCAAKMSAIFPRSRYSVYKPHVTVRYVTQRPTVKAVLVVRPPHGFVVFYFRDLQSKEGRPTCSGTLLTDKTIARDQRRASRRAAGRKKLKGAPLSSRHQYTTFDETWTGSRSYPEKQK